MKTAKPTIEEIAQRFGCTPKEVGVQFAKNWTQLKAMYEKACETGKRVNGYTSEQLRRMMNDLPMGK